MLLFTSIDVFKNECLTFVCRMSPRGLTSARKEVSQKRRHTLENVISQLYITMANRSTAPSNGQSVFDLFNCHHLPTFDGTYDPVVLEGWIREMEKLFAATGCPATYMVPIDTYYLKLEANKWWNIVCASYMATPVFGWDQFQVKLKERFYHDELCWQKHEEFLALSHINSECSGVH